MRCAREILAQCFLVCGAVNTAARAVTPFGLRLQVIPWETKGTAQILLNASGWSIVLRKRAHLRTEERE